MDSFTQALLAVVTGFALSGLVSALVHSLWRTPSRKDVELLTQRLQEQSKLTKHGDMGASGTHVDAHVQMSPQV